MSSLVVSLLAFIGMAGGALGAQYFARTLAAHHVTPGTQDTVKLGVGMVAAMTSLILGLMTASVKSNFDSTDKDVHSYSLYILNLNSDLRHAGADACPARQLLMDYAIAVGRETWSDASAFPKLDRSIDSENILLDLDAWIRNWEVHTPLLTEVRVTALADLRALQTVRWTVSQEAVASVPGIFLLVLIVWLSLIFFSFGLFAPSNAVVSAFFLLCALSISGALFLILEMSGPFDGLIAVSPDPLLRAIGAMKAHPCP